MCDSTGGVLERFSATVLLLFVQACFGPPTDRLPPDLQECPQDAELSPKLRGFIDVDEQSALVGDSPTGRGYQARVAGLVTETGAGIPEPLGTGRPHHIGLVSGSQERFRWLTIDDGSNLWRVGFDVPGIEQLPSIGTHVELAARMNTVLDGYEWELLYSSDEHLAYLATGYSLAIATMFDEMTFEEGEPTCWTSTSCAVVADFAIRATRGEESVELPPEETTNAFGYTFTVAQHSRIVDSRGSSCLTHVAGQVSFSVAR